jgi:hypothetical protein
MAMPTDEYLFHDTASFLFGVTNPHKKTVERLYLALNRLSFGKSTPQ